MTYCCMECKNKECAYNYRHYYKKPWEERKYELLRVEGLLGTKVCKGYKRP